MTEVINHRPYPEREEYLTPNNPDEQLAEVLRLYPDRAECMWFLHGLDMVYKNQPYMIGFKIGAEIAADVRAERSNLPPSEKNNDFYQGILLATYINIQPIQDPSAIRYIMQVPPKDTLATVADLRQQIPRWICEDPELYWEALEELSPELQASVETFSKRYHPIDTVSRADFMAGFCFSDDLIRKSISISAESGAQEIT